MIVGVAVIMFIVLTVCFIYSNVQDDNRFEEWRRRTSYEVVMNERFNIDLKIHHETLMEFLEKENLPWEIVEVKCSTYPIWYSPSKDGVIFDEPWKIIDWMKLGGVNKDGKEQYTASLREAFYGWYVVFYFRRIKKND